MTTIFVPDIITVPFFLWNIVNRFNVGILDGVRSSRLKVILDPLKFRDSRIYTDRISEARSKTNQDDAILLKKGTIGGEQAVVAVLNFEFMGGSMGSAVGEGIISAGE